MRRAGIVDQPAIRGEVPLVEGGVDRFDDAASLVGPVPPTRSWIFDVARERHGPPTSGLDHLGAGLGGQRAGATSGIAVVVSSAVRILVDVDECHATTFPCSETLARISEKAGTFHEFHRCLAMQRGHRVDQLIGQTVTYLGGDDGRMSRGRPRGDDHGRPHDDRRYRAADRFLVGAAAMPGGLRLGYVGEAAERIPDAGRHADADASLHAPVPMTRDSIPPDRRRGAIGAADGTSSAIRPTEPPTVTVRRPAVARRVGPRRQRRREWLHGHFADVNADD